MYKACSVCGKIHPYNYKCKRKEKREDLHNSTAWHKKSKDIRERSKYICEVCLDQFGKGGSAVLGNSVEVHHIIKVKDEPDLLLDDDNLICLCRMHHEEAEAGKLSKEYLTYLVEKRKKREATGGI